MLLKSSDCIKSLSSKTSEDALPSSSSVSLPASSVNVIIQINQIQGHEILTWGAFTYYVSSTRGGRGFGLKLTFAYGGGKGGFMAKLT